jgi:hypothetical protein
MILSALWIYGAKQIVLLMHDGLLISRLIWIYLYATINAYVTIIVYNYSAL